MTDSPDIDKQLRGAKIMWAAVPQHAKERTMLIVR